MVSQCYAFGTGAAASSLFHCVQEQLCLKSMPSRSVFHIYYPLWSLQLEFDIHDHCPNFTDKQSKTQILSQGSFAGASRISLP